MPNSDFRALTLKCDEPYCDLLNIFWFNGSVYFHVQTSSEKRVWRGEFKETSSESRVRRGEFGEVSSERRVQSDKFRETCSER